MEGDVDSHERLAKLETNMEHVLDKLGILNTDVEGLKSVIWKAAGGVGVAVILVQFLLKGH